MASIGGVNCHIVRGDAPDKTARLDVWDRPGVNSPGTQNIGQAGAFEFRAILYDAYADVLAWARSIEALVGTVVTITNDWAQAFTGCLITEASTPKISYSYSSSGNARGEIVVRGRLT